MDKEKDKIFYDPYNEIRCDRFALENLVKENEEKDQKIAELEKKLENAIVPKFKIGDKVYANTVDYWENNKPVRHTTQEEVEEIIYFYKLKGYWFKEWEKEEIFATEEEAEAKLKEIMKSE